MFPAEILVLFFDSENIIGHVKTSYLGQSGNKPNQLSHQSFQ